MFSALTFERLAAPQVTEYPTTDAHLAWITQLRAVDLMDQISQTYDFSRAHRGHGGWPRLFEYDVANVVM